MSSSDANENTPLLNSVENQPNAASFTSSPPANYQSQEGAAATLRGTNEAHVVNMTSDDEELLEPAVREGARQNVRHLGGAPLRRFNPFERVVQSQPGQPDGGVSVIEGGGVSPYSPIGEEHSSSSAWSRFVRYASSSYTRRVVLKFPPVLTANCASMFATNHPKRRSYRTTTTSSRLREKRAQSLPVAGIRSTPLAITS